MGHLVSFRMILRSQSVDLLFSTTTGRAANELSRLVSNDSALASTDLPSRLKSNYGFLSFARLISTKRLDS